jgi:hypothetical protein
MLCICLAIPASLGSLIMVYDLFDTLLNSVCQYFIEDFFIYVNLKRLASNSLFFVVPLSGWG